MPRDALEVIVVNDGGTPVRRGLLDGLQGFVLAIPVNGGLSAALNAGLAHAHGDYLTIASDDDLVLPDKLLALSDALDAEPATTVATFGLPIYTDLLGYEKGCPPTVDSFARRHPVVTSEIALAEGLYVHGTGLMYRTHVIRDAGGWDETLPTAEEWDLHHRLLRFHGVFRFVDAFVVTYREGGKHCQYHGKRPRHVMNRIYDKLGVARRDASGKGMA
jgi:glycosyltransferase involved in cell wall biosynthesis